MLYNITYYRKLFNKFLEVYLMNGAYSLAASVFMLAFSYNVSVHAGALDAPEPIVRDYSIPMEIEKGYIPRDELLRDISGMH